MSSVLYIINLEDYWESSNMMLHWFSIWALKWMRWISHDFGKPKKIKEDQRYISVVACLSRMFIALGLIATTTTNKQQNNRKLESLLWSNALMRIFSLNLIHESPKTRTLLRTTGPGFKLPRFHYWFNIFRYLCVWEMLNIIMIQFHVYTTWIKLCNLRYCYDD